MLLGIGIINCRNGAFFTKFSKAYFVEHETQWVLETFAGSAAFSGFFINLILPLLRKDYMSCVKD